MMTEMEFMTACSTYDIDPPPKFYERFVKSFEDRNMLDEPFFRMLKRFLKFENGSAITICKMIRFIVHLARYRDLSTEMDRAKTLGEQIGKRMQRKLEEYRDFRIKMRQPIDTTEYVPGENF